MKKASADKSNNAQIPYQEALNELKGWAIVGFSDDTEILKAISHYAKVLQELIDSQMPHDAFKNPNALDEHEPNWLDKQCVDSLEMVEKLGVKNGTT